MAILTKLDFPSDGSLVSERDKYLQLYDQAGKSTIGNLQFTSTSSSTVYDTTSTEWDNQGEEGLLGLLTYGDRDNISYSDPTMIIYNLDKTAYDAIKTEVETNATNLDIARIAETDTGTANAYVVSTSGTFSRVDGNILNFIPANNNTGASTINEDDNGVATIKKYVDGAWVALEEGDLKKFQQVQLVWNASESAFQLAPKGGALELPSENSIFTNFSSSVAQTMNLVLSVSGEGFVSQLSSSSTAFNYVSVEIDGIFILGTISSGVILRNGMLALFKKFDTSLKVYFQDNTVAQVFYVLGKEYLKGTPMAYTATTNVGALANTINISGKGKLISISGSGNASNYDLAIDIDGVTVFPTSDDSANVYGTLVLNWNFETSFEIRGDTALKATYQLD